MTIISQKKIKNYILTFQTINKPNGGIKYEVLLDVGNGTPPATLYEGDDGQKAAATFKSAENDLPTI